MSEVPRFQWHRPFTRWPVFWLTVLLLAALFAQDTPTRNESDRLASARQVCNPDWLPTDWFLNQNPDYRRWFQLTIGRVTLLPFGEAAMIGRLITFIAWAAAFQLLAFRLRLHPLSAVAAVGVFTFAQSIGAGEWMVGSFETKPLAYAALIAAIAFMMERAALRAALCIGLAVSFHVLIGAFASLAAVPVLALWLWRRELPWRRVPSVVLLYAVGASFGLWAIAGHLAGSGEAPLSVADAARSATIYVQFRNPHHLLFIAFDPAWKWPLALIGTMAFLAAILLRSGANPHHRLLAGYALCTAPFFLFGILLGALGANSLLRYYWFRVPDTLLPFASIVLAAAFIQQWMQRREWLATAAWQRTARIAPLVLAGVLLAVCSVFAVQRATLSRPTFEASMPEGLADALVFAREHTPRDAVFLVEPSLDSFYLVAERAMFVAWRHMPATPPLILEWHQRLIACGGGIEPESSGWSALTEIRKRMHELSAAQVQQLVADWKLTHLLVDNRYNPFGDFADDDLPAGITRVFGGATHSIYAFDPVP